jgi:homoserine dehydrogenase
MYLALIGPGLVGKAVLEQIKWYQQTGKRYPPLNVLGICSSKKRMHGTLQYPLDLKEWQSIFDSNGSIDSNNKHVQVEDCGNLDLFIAELYHLCNGHQATLCVVDCTSSLEVAEKYAEWLQKGLHVVTPNKKAFSATMEYYDVLQDLSKKKPRGYPMLMHESTCGAGLPVLSTLKDLVNNSGDEMERIEGILSGTLSYLFNQFSSTVSNSHSKKQTFSEIVKQAKELGYTVSLLHLAFTYSF